MSDEIKKDHPAPTLPPLPVPPEAMGRLSVETDEMRDMEIVLPEGLDAVEALESPPPHPDEAPLLWEEAEMALEMEAEEPAAQEGSLAGHGAEAVAFYRREALALASRQPERAALMRIEAASLSEQAGAETEAIHGDMDAALELLPQSGWLVSRVRRLLVRLGSYERAIKLGQREAKLGGDPANLAALLLESAAVIRYHLGNPQVALQILKQALDVRPNAIPALWAFASLSQESGKHAEASQALERLADNLTHPGQRALCLYATATLLERRLGQEEQAQAVYRRALEADPKFVPATLALTESYRQQEQWAELSRTLEHLADLLQEPHLRSELFLEAGTLHLDRTGDLTAATRDLGRAARAAPENRTVLRRLAQAWLMEGRTREAIETLRQLEALTPDIMGRATLLTQVGTMYTALGEFDLAAAVYKSTLETVPGYVPAIQEFGTLCRKRGDFEGLVAIGQQESESRLPASARAVRHLELADILDRRLNRPEEAAAAYRRAIELQPELHLAYWSLAALLRRNRWLEELVELLRTHARVCTDERSRAHLLFEAGRLQVEALGNVDAALEIFQEAGVECSPASVIFSLIELHAGQGQHAELVELLLKHAEMTTDAMEAESRRLWAALILEQEMNEREKALRLLRSVLESNPKSYSAIHAIGRILHHQGAWEDLVKLYVHELSVEPDRPDAAALLCRMGHIIEERIGNGSAAIGAYSRALRQDPTYAPALDPLEALVRREGQWPKLVEVLQAYAQAVGDPAEAAAALGRAAHVACWQLGHADQALELYRRALERTPTTPAILTGLFQVQYRQQDWAGAAASLETLIGLLDEGEERALRLLQLARLRELNLEGEPDLELYLQVAASPFGEQLREEILRVRRARLDEELHAHLAGTGKQTPDDALSAAHLLDAAYLMEFGGRPGEQLLEVIKLAYARQTDLAIGWSLERTLRREGLWVELAELLENQARLELDRNIRVQQLALTGEAFWRGERAEEADRVSRECLNFDAHCLPALRTLISIASARQSWPALAELTDRLAEASADPENRQSGCFGAAEIWMNQVGDPARALASLSVVLADNPDHPEAFTRAESLLRERREFEDISRLYQRRIRASADQGTRAELYWRHAQLLRHDLERPDRAIVEINELLRLTPENTAALSALADLHEKLGHWSDAAAALENLLEHTADPTLRHDARLRLTGLWLERLHDPRRARAVLEQAAEESRGDLEVARLRVRLAAKTGEWAEASQYLQEVMDAAEGGIRAWCLLQQAEIARTGQRDPEAARQHTVAALEVAARDESARRELCQGSLITAEERERLLAVAEEVLQAGQTSDPNALRAFVVRLLLDDLDQPARAIPHLERLRAEAPDDVSIALLGARALERSGNPTGAVAQYRQIVERDLRCVEAYRGLLHAAPGPIAAAAATLLEELGQQPDERAADLLRRLEELPGPVGFFPTAFLQPTPSERQILELLDLLLPALAEAFPSPTGERIDLSHPAAQLTGRLAQTLGLARVAVAIGGPRGARVVAGDPLLLLVAPTHTTAPLGPAFRTWVSHALALGPATSLLHGLDGLQLQELEDALSSRRPASPDGQRLRKTLLGSLSRKERKELEGVEVQPAELAAFRETRWQRASRAAVVLSLQPGAAIRQLALAARVPETEIFQRSPFAELVRFALSEEHAALFRGVWGDSL